MTRSRMVAAALAALLCSAAAAGASHVPGGGCTDCASHKYWPTIDGVIKKADVVSATYVGTERSDELLGHHGSDTIDGGPGADVIWGDWDPRENNETQRDVLRGGDGNDRIYPSHGVTRVQGGRGNDFVHAYYGRGVIDCGPGYDTARVRWQSRQFRLRSCERVRHFCAFGTRPDGGCYKPGEKPRR